MRQIIITRPDDWHVHFRDGVVLQHTVLASARHFKRVLAMPNLKPPLTELADIKSYRQRVLMALPENSEFTPYFTFYLNEQVQPGQLQEAASLSYILGAKWYPAGATTNSEAGVENVKKIYPLLEIMQESNLVLQIHGEITTGDIFEREALFLKNGLTAILKDFPRLRVVLEHISTKEAVDFVKESSAQIAATITPHHLFYNRNHLLAGGIRPHFYCLPILKHARDQKALQEIACSGNPKFFAGTDSAPHAVKTKESACGCAGIYSAPYALALYAQIFDSADQLNKLNAFMGHFGANFYQLPISKEQIELVQRSQCIPSYLPMGEDEVVPIAANETILWSVNESH